MRQLDLSLSLRSDARVAIILMLPDQLDTDVLPRDVVDAIALCRGTVVSSKPFKRSCGQVG